ncbi:N-6 DNA methylase [Candidatus Poribacteria bacterium]|nr:N-6 DNA methylase [Candidatus Poribacteria bacterium]MYA58240.1 N-6 DNA methylase [Candidatus Poribacteria bacterium]
MNFQTCRERYLQSLQQTQTVSEATPELSLYPHLQVFLEDIATAHFGRDTVRFTQEPRRLNQIGRPDFIAMDGLLPVGYIEAEAYGRDLDALTGHAREQNTRFIENLDNFILTNFVEFRLYMDGQLRATANITDTPENLEGLLERFLDIGGVQIASPEALAGYLARRTRELQTQIATTLTDESSNTHVMFSAFRETLISTLTSDDFADMYAQTLAYGLFAARCTLPNATNFSRHTAVEALPRSNPFLVQLFYHVASPTLETNVTYILDDIASLLQNVPTEMLRTAFAARNHLEDPVIHFYETFLAEYDPQRRVDRGVYYTPPQVISYIVRSVDSLLKTELNRPDGLADDGTLILDPATGTGGFLLAVLDHIRESVTETYGTGEWIQYINAALVKRIFGFELLVAPYTIAHLKLSLFLQAQGWRADERLRIYLTNTLENPGEMQPSLPFAGFISDEANAALSVKRDEPLLVILGNPPYTRHSANPSRVKGNLTFIGELIEDYRQVDGQPLDEDTSKALQDDYVKFIRWAQWRIDKNGEGIVGYIVNNNFLDAPTVRGMRQSLLEGFNTIYLLNLHGSNRRTEAVPEAERDENVFDISQGVCILLCVKESDNPAPAKVYYADMWGSREEKYNALSEADVKSTMRTARNELQPTSPDYLFVPQARDYKAEYDKMEWKIIDIFQTSSIGIVTARDKLTIHWTAEEVRETVTDFVSLSVNEAREKYNLRKDTQDWKVHLAQTDLHNHPDAEQHIKPILYRPFDTRWTYYTGESRGFQCRPRPENMPHLLASNIALSVCRIVKSPAWQHVLITDKITENCYISNTTSESGHVFPLYLYPDPEELGISTERALNFKPGFLTALSEALKLSQVEPFKLPQGISPEEILAYIYAVLYSPTYRKRYYEFLKYDFPRIPLPQDITQFRTLSTLGQRLIDCHLLKESRPEVAPTGRGVPVVHRFEGEGDGIVSRVRYVDGKVWINPTQHFTNVPLAVWEYEVGAYQVCEKWLKDRRGEMLRYEDVRQYRAILVAVAETLQVMAEIDGFS